MKYTDDYDRRDNKRPRTRSRSPYRGSFREIRKPKKYSDDELDPGNGEKSYARGFRERGFSTEQLVSERGSNPVVAPAPGHKSAETRENQVQQQASSTATDSGVNRYVYSGLTVFLSLLLLLLSSNTNIFSAPTEPEQEQQPAEPVDESAQLEARRKRREAIRAKYKSQANPLQLQALHAGIDHGAVESETSTPSTEPNREVASNAMSGRFTLSLIRSRVPKLTLLVVSPQLSPSQTPNENPMDPFTDFKVGKDDDLVNESVTVNGDEKDEPSAADYDPTLDMKKDRERHGPNANQETSSAAYDETQPAKQDILLPDAPEQPSPPPPPKAKDPYDMFAEDDDDDMFAEDNTQEQTHATQSTHAAAVPQPRELDISMMDNWDDPEGYYNVRLGELINGRYHVQQNLGKGMFSSVVRATDSQTGGLVAVKIIRQNDTMRKAGMKEIGILEQLQEADPDDKKHMIKFQRYFDHKGHLCMVFENLSMNLREVLKKFGRDVGLNLRAIRAYAQQMFLGLSLMRKCNIVHADLKPDNLLVNEQRNVLKVCDLGSASPMTDNEITPYLVSRFYRAPEIMLGIPYDHGIDVWSVGCTLFELYTGKILFTGRNNNQMLRSIMECRGKYPPKLLRRGSLAHAHFDEMLNFHSTEEDKVTGRLVTRVVDFRKPTRDLKTRLMGKDAAVRLSDSEAKELTQFVDLLERCLSLNPEKRCTPQEALRHPFIWRPR